MRIRLWLLLAAATGMFVPAARPHVLQAQDYQAGDVRQIRIPGTDVSFELVFVPDGVFDLGSPTDEPGRDDDEGPQLSVQMSAFWMGRFEVSGDEFAVFRFPDRDADSTAAPGGSYSVDAVSRPSTPYEDPSFGMGTARTPATGMTQWAALQYAKWMTAKTGVFFRLPTEAEWEYACKAGTDGNGTIGGDDAEEGDDGVATELDAFAWHAGNSDDRLHHIGQKSPNSWGLYDLLGNASEWTLDEYHPEAYAQFEDQHRNPWTQPTRRHPRTVRGGTFRDEARTLRCANRLGSTLDWKRRDPQIPQSEWWNTDSPFLGFRLAMPVVQPSPEEQEAFWRLVLGE